MIYISVYAIITTIAALIMYFIGGNSMDALVAAIIGLIGAVISAVVTIVIDMRKSRRRSEVIVDEINRTQNDVKEVKTDTTVLRPTANNVREDTKIIRAKVTEDVVPRLQMLSTLSNKIEDIHSEVEYQKRLKAELSASVQNRDYFLSGINKLYAMNARLQAENKELQLALQQEKEKNLFLTNQIEEWKEEYSELWPDEPEQSHWEPER